MVDETSKKQESTEIKENGEASSSKQAREIRGNIPYSASPGSITKVLDSLISAERPDKFNYNFMETVLGQSGGGARTVPPLMKKMGFLEGDGTPTELYSRFKTESGRGAAAFEGLKRAFFEIFRKNEFAHKATDDQIRDAIIEITGLPSNDAIIRHMINTFNSIRGYIPADLEKVAAPEISETGRPADDVGKGNLNPIEVEKGGKAPSLGLSYQINIVLPETEDAKVYDEIFKSIRRNLLV